MAFRSPNFNLLCNIFTGAAFQFPQPSTIFSAAPRIAGVACALVLPEALPLVTLPVAGGISWPFQLSSLLLPALTDIRGFQSPGLISDGVEVPAGSGRYYSVGSFDDRGKGHPNEHRVALIMPQLGDWPAPAP